MRKKNWFWKTLKGYRVIIATKDKDYIVIHRPFRSPYISDSIPKHNTKLFAHHDEMAIWLPETLLNGNGSDLGGGSDVQK